MNRKYSREHYLDLIREVREIMPDIKISTDIMIGFPGETEEEFLDTLSLMREVRYDSSFDFVYSPRKGTPAASMPDQIPEDVKQQRIMQIVALQSALTFESNLRNVGKTELILIEGKSSRDPSMIAGKTDGGVMVNCRGDISLVGEIIPVKITEAKKTTLIGERI
jgi:tRNA-2-methylthio-N6-dimethylallyladenosine synthase